MLQGVAYRKKMGCCSQMHLLGPGLDEVEGRLMEMGTRAVASVPGMEAGEVEVACAEKFGRGAI